jgi:hypothetical protein
MATTNFLVGWTAGAALLPTSNYAVWEPRNNHLVLGFDDTTQWTAYFEAVMPDTYSNATGVTVYVRWAAKTATTGTIGWDVTFERIEGASQDLDSDGFATAQTITAATVDGTSGNVTTTSVACAKGSTGMDSVVAGDHFRIRLRRDVANDTASGNAQVISVSIVET